MLSRLESEKKEAAAKNKEIQDAMQYEIDFFKKEVARLGRTLTPTKADNFFGLNEPKSLDDDEKEPTTLKKMINREMITPIQHQKRGGPGSSDERFSDNDEVH